MSRGGLSRTQPRFEGHQRLATVSELDAFVARAAKNERFIYCEAPQLIPGATADHVRELSRRGIVTPHQEHRAGGGRNYFVMRTGYVLRASVGEDGRADKDDASDVILRLLKRAANLGQRCPSDAELAAKVRDELSLDIFTRDQAQARIRKWIDKGVIRSTVATENGVPTRVVTIVATAKQTALPAKWAAAAASVQREQGGAK